jgi:hypothetical protein
MKGIRTSLSAEGKDHAREVHGGQIDQWGGIVRRRCRNRPVTFRHRSTAAVVSLSAWSALPFQTAFSCLPWRSSERNTIDGSDQQDYRDDAHCDLNRSPHSHLLTLRQLIGHVRFPCNWFQHNAWVPGPAPPLRAIAHVGQAIGASGGDRKVVPGRIVSDIQLNSRRMQQGVVNQAMPHSFLQTGLAFRVQ